MLLAVCLVAMGFVVLIQNGIAEGQLRRQLDNAYDAFGCEWRGFTEAIRRRRVRESWRCLWEAVSAWFRLQNLTGAGRAGSAAAVVLAGISLFFLLINLVLLLRAAF
ncbi:MAG TPA: hypothetical protein VEK57_04525 [Thermoanaerobaculia bacterium]|nr:hypothetical protein [Thermoanaerobaculia bacterium]